MEPIKSIYMTTAAYSQIPASLRRTVDGTRFVFMGQSGEWLPVVFTRA